MKILLVSGPQTSVLIEPAARQSEDRRPRFFKTQDVDTLDASAVVYSTLTGSVSHVGAGFPKILHASA